MKTRLLLLTGALGLLMAIQSPADPLSSPSPTASASPTAAAMPSASSFSSPPPQATVSPSGSPAGEADLGQPTPKKPGVYLQFVPPPMEGTISMGVYDTAGKLVRILHREAATDGDDFVVANDGLVTSWDGKDDAGKPMPPGQFTAHGWMVGDLQVKGVAILGNDWITDDDSPRICDIRELFALPDGGFGISALLADGKVTLLAFGADGKPSQSNGGLEDKAVVRDGQVILQSHGVERVIPAQGLSGPIAASPARNGGVWVIDRDASGVSVKEFAADGTFERHLAIAPNDPQPEQIAASPVADTIYLLERNAQVQRIRALTLVSPDETGGISHESPSPVSSPAGSPAGAEKTSVWKIAWEKKIWNMDSLAGVLPRLKLQNGKSFVPQGSINVILMKNSMDQGKSSNQSLMAGIEADGSCLKASDGLPLRMLSDTPHLRWIAMGLASDGKGELIFQSDGAAVEEFLVAHPERMMRFDSGAFSLNP